MTSLENPPSSASTPLRDVVSAQAANLFLLEDLDDANRTRKLAENDVAALRIVADWISTFVGQPHKDVGRAGAVCPYVPGARDRKKLWLAHERISGLGVADTVQLVNRYKSRVLNAQSSNVDDAIYKSIVVVFSDLSADRAKDLFNDVLQQLGAPSYVEDGLVLGAFYEGNEGAAIYNPSFRSFAAPVPFLLIRRAIISDWKFFLSNDTWLKRWAGRYGESAVLTLAEELRRLPWRMRRD